MTQERIVRPQRVSHFACQSVFLTLGKQGGFKTLDDFLKFAKNDCGFEAVSIPTCPPLIDMAQASKSKSYCADLLGKYEKHGLPLLRLEGHTSTQCVCLDPSRKLKFGHFMSPKFRKLKHRQIEKLAVKEVKKAIDVTAALGLKHLVAFCGGRSFAVAQAKWAAWPKYIAAWSLALLAYKWNDILEYAAERGVILMFEIGHPENDLLTAQ
ncbi:MAG: TIM barrel protein, partial [Candidatus Pacebacteria bacterium]|nr:TIM barrel protein [Candidatus Paceibacterota bacterium]